MTSMGADGWAQSVSSKTGKVFYVHLESGVSQWFPPPLDRCPERTTVQAAYNQVALNSNTERRTSHLCKAMRRYNNYCKAYAIHFMVQQATGYSTQPLRVLDLAGGRGGCLPKWTHYRDCIDSFVHIDAAPMAVAAARERARTCPVLREQHADGEAPPTREFVSFVADCRSLPSDFYKAYTHQFTCASCHFALNYLASDAASIEALLRQWRPLFASGGFLSIIWLPGERLDNKRLLSEIEEEITIGRTWHEEEGKYRRYTFETADGTVPAVPEYAIPAADLLRVVETNELGWQVMLYFDDLHDLPQDVEKLNDTFRPHELVPHATASRLYAWLLLQAVIQV